MLGCTMDAWRRESDGIVESYYLETQDELFFAVKGLEHPPDRWIAVLRYAPDLERRDRSREGKFYRRLYRFDEQKQFIQATCPQYLAFDPEFQTMLQSVPRSSVRRVYDPRRKFHELVQGSVRNPIERDALAFLQVLQNQARIPSMSLGITGSLLIDLSTEKSDLDIVVFGAFNCNKVYQALHVLLDSPSEAELRRLNSQGIDELFAQRVVDTDMAFEEFARLEKRKVNQGTFRGRTFFIRFVKDIHEAGYSYGRRRYTSLGRAFIHARIEDDQESIFTPCRYCLSDVRILEGMKVSDLNEIVSFRGRFCEQAHAGDRVRAAGTLERVEDKEGNLHYRLLLGNFINDTLVPLAL